VDPLFTALVNSGPMMLVQSDPFVAHDDALAVGRRGSPRLRLAIPARFVSRYATHACILLDLSRSGARVALERPLGREEPGYLEIAGLDVFGGVVRSEAGLEGGTNAIAFDEPITGTQVLEIRRFAETFEKREREGLRVKARRWVNGEP
jgi:hypothetical protein